MKYLKRFILAIILFLSAFTSFAGGIKDAKELVAFINTINNGEDITPYRNDKGEICLEADIDMSKVKKLSPIKTFGAVFNGQGFALKNWKAQNGLIDELLEGGKVCNLVIDGSCSMKAQNKNGTNFIGWVAHVNNGTVENCESHAQIIYKSGYSIENIYVGGLVGSNRYVIYRSRNYGTISVNCSSCAPDVIIYVGGIAGANYHKTIHCATIARCENQGSVSYAGDAAIDRVGGIVGEAFKATTKLCVNRGNICSITSLGDNLKPGTSTVGGIVGLCKSDIICCDNFGHILASGANISHVGGIVGIPHTTLVIADCTNYGIAETTSDLPSNAGGIAATIGREVHIVNGTNRGIVHFAGSSPNSPSCIGGIVGSIYTTRDAKFNAYLRRCTNYGLVDSESGGNNYENHDRAIHTGGIVGRAIGVPSAQIRLLDCANKGEVKAVSGRRGNIAGLVSSTKVSGGWTGNNYAESTEPLSDGSTIYGRVTDITGEPVAGCVVSDGIQCVETDGYGYYALKSDMSSTRFVFISIPADYKIPFENGVVQNFRRIPRYKSAAAANFTLEKRTEPTDKYTVIMIGDPQMRGLGHDNSGERYRDVVLPDIEDFKKTVTGEFFSINVGDLVYNWMSGYDDYLDINALVTYPVFHIIGNHDYDQMNILEGKLGTPYFEEYISPTYYSFTIGKIHYVMVNNIEYSRKDHTVGYLVGLDDEQMKWLEEDLKFIPKDYTIYICGHGQLFKKKGTSPNGSFGKRNINYKRYSELLKQYKRVYSWAGHYHANYGYDYAGNPRFPDMGHVSCITVARANGQLRSNMELNVDGQPNGYMVVEIDGEDVKWWFKTVGHDRNYQMRSYSPTRTGDGYVKVNIWNYSPDYWSAIEWWENGIKVGEFEKNAEVDPDYVRLHAEKLSHLRGRAAEYAQPIKSDYMFRIKPSEGIRKGEIRVTDNFGVTYTEKVEW